MYMDAADNYIGLLITDQSLINFVWTCTGGLWLRGVYQEELTTKSRTTGTLVCARSLASKSKLQKLLLPPLKLQKPRTQILSSLAAAAPAALSKTWKLCKITKTHCWMILLQLRIQIQMKKYNGWPSIAQSRFLVLMVIIWSAGACWNFYKGTLLNFCTKILSWVNKFSFMVTNNCLLTHKLYNI